MSQFILPARATNANSQPLSGATINFYLAGTTTPVDVYVDSDLTTPHTNPVVADAGGLFPSIYTDPSITYRAFLKTATGAHISDFDPYLQPSDLTGSPLLGSEVGVAPSGSTNALDVARTFTGAANGTTQFYGQVHRVYAQGANNIDYARNSYFGTHVDTTAGTTAVADGLHQYIWLGGAGNVTAATGIAAHIRVDGPGDITGEAQCFRAVSTTLGATGSVNRIVGYSVGDIGHATRVTDAFGVDVPDLAASTLAIAFRTSMSAGTNKYAVFAAGTAPSAFGGKVRVGDTATNPAYGLDVMSNDENFAAAVQNRNGVGPSGLRVIFTGAAPNNTTQEAIRFEDTASVRFRVWSNGRTDSAVGFSVLGTNVVGARQAGTPAAATDLATALTLVNDLRAKLITHGLIA